MEDIQFWLYLAFAAIYFLTRGMKKKKPPQANPNRQKPSNQTRPTRKPVTFEELLQEFTEGKKEEVEEEEESPQYYREEKKTEPVFEEGKTRRFSDAESKAVYERSIQMAEGADLEFKRDEHFKSSIQRRAEGEKENEVASSIKEMLQNPESAKKAVILGEILNRKY